MIGVDIMEWEHQMGNHKGFLHHPETDDDDRQFYIQQKEIAYQLLEIGRHFVEHDGVLHHRSIPCSREELAVGAKYLHRGAYCPSPVLDLLITNTKRGKILRRPSPRSKISNRFIFDASGKLLYTDNYLFDGKLGSSEYLLYEGDTVYGVTLAQFGGIVSVSRERYAQGRIVSYDCAYYAPGLAGIECFQMFCERYHYDDIGLLTWEYYQLHFSFEAVATSGFVKHERFRFTREDGRLTSFIPVTPEGKPMEDYEPTVVRSPRKA
jgi:hypothetical protein